MLDPFEYVVWIIAFVLQVGLVVWTLCHKDFARYFSITVYMFSAAVVNCLEYACIEKYGVASDQYYYCYYYSESLLTILMFFVIIQFYQQVFAEMNVSRYLRVVASVLLAGTAIFSYIVVRQNREYLTVHFVGELGQNLHFLGVVLTYVLWGAVLKLRETRRQLVHLVLALGIYFGLTAGTYALRNLFPGLYAPVLRWILPLIGIWLPAAWAYTIIRLPKESRMVMSELTAKARA